MKTTFYTYFSLLFTCFLLSGCGGDSDDYISKYCPGSCTVIKGRLTTANGTKPLAHVSMAVNWQSEGYLSGGSTHKKAIAETDDDGNYELRFLIRDDELIDGYFIVEPALNISKYVYCHSDVLNLDFYNLKRDTTYVANYGVPEKAYITFKLNNPDALQTGDELTTSYTYSFGEDGQEMCYNDIKWHIGYKNNYSVNVEVAADQPLLLEQVKLNNGVETTEQNTVQLDAGETRVVDINF